MQHMISGIILIPPMEDRAFIHSVLRLIARLVPSQYQLFRIKAVQLGEVVGSLLGKSALRFSSRNSCIRSPRKMAPKQKEKPKHTTDEVHEKQVEL